MHALLTGLKAAAEPTRLRVLSILARGELTVSELTRVLGQSQPRVSRHLKLLCDAGLLDRYQEGAWVFYRMAEHGSGASLARDLVGRIPADDPVVARDRERLVEIKRDQRAAASAYFEHVAARWDEIRSLFADDAVVEAAMLEAVGDAPIGTHVDLGTGTGRILKLFAQRVDKAIGFDLSHEMLRVARTGLDDEPLAHCQVRKGDIYDIAMPTASADLVTIHHVLHFLDDPAAALAEAARILRPGGRLLVVDFAPHTLERLREEHSHRRLGFADEEVAQWLEAAGLEWPAVRHIAPTARSDAGHITVALWSASSRADASARGRLEVA